MGTLAAAAAVREGLEGVVATATRLSLVDGQAGRLVLAGFAVEELAPRATFEELLYLLWHGRLPEAGELAALRAALAVHERLPPAVLDVLRAAAAAGLTPVDSLRLGVAALSLTEGAGRSLARDAELLAGVFPALVGTCLRLAAGQAPAEPLPGLSYAARLLQQAQGRAPDPTQARALETYLNTVSDHGLNASTFTARVIVSTGSDLLSAVGGALGALKGPLHGGAPGPALEMVFEIGRAERAEPELRARLARGERLMGFGHRVYRTRDPRADVLAAEAQRLFAGPGDRALYDLARHVEDVALRLLAEAKPGRALATNVEFYTALLLHGLGFDASAFTPLFAAGRLAGWTAHAREQVAQGRLIRPQSLYVGPDAGRYQPLDERG